MQKEETHPAEASYCVRVAVGPPIAMPLTYNCKEVAIDAMNDDAAAEYKALQDASPSQLFSVQFASGGKARTLIERMEGLGSPTRLYLRHLATYSALHASSNTPPIGALVPAVFDEC